MNGNTRKMMAAVAAVLAAGFTGAQTVGTIVTEEGKELKGEIHWKASSKVYIIKQGKIDVEWPLGKVQELSIPRPKELDASASIATLEKIVQQYTMLTWDEEATRLLAAKYLEAGQTEKAIRACESIIRAKENAAYIGPMAPMYWDALVKAGRSAKAEELMQKAIQTGDRNASAFALVRRGDIVMVGGDTPENARKALRDGYLRVTLLYENCPDAVPEALYKSAKCFDRMGQAGRADTARRTLKEKYPNSEWARK